MQYITANVKYSLVRESVRLVRGQCRRSPEPPPVGSELPSHCTPFPGFCNWHGPCCVLHARFDDNYTRRHIMTILSSKLTSFAAALLMNGLIMGAMGYLF